MRPTRLPAAIAACLLTLTIPLASRLLANSNAAAMMDAPAAWQQGYTGQGVLVGVWDQRHIGDHTNLRGHIITIQATFFILVVLATFTLYRRYP